MNLFLAMFYMVRNTNKNRKNGRRSECARKMSNIRLRRCREKSQ